MKKIIIGFFAILSLAASASLMVNKNTEVNAEGGNANLEVNEIFKGFYNNGVYVKDTQIFVDENKVKNAVLENNDALINHFHGGHITLNRTTYYEEDELYFSYGSGYGTETAEVDGQTVTYLTRFTMKDGVKQGEYTIYDLPGMEEYYCTLDDFVKGAHDSNHVEEPLDLTDWHLEGDVYASTNDDILEAFRLFTAPTWLNKTPSNANFITFAKATVEVVGPTLVMKLWAEGDEGKLFDGVETYGDYHLFSKAIIVKDKEAYQVANGGFEDGLTGWNLQGRLGAVTNTETYWDDHHFFKNDGYFFSSYADDFEGAIGELVSSNFVVGGSGWMTFKIGAGHDSSLVNLQVVDAATGDILKTFGNTSCEGTDCTLVSYKVDIRDLIGKEVYIRVVDYSYRDYGCFFLDSVKTYYTSEPVGDEKGEFIETHDLGIEGNVYQLFNGGFERGDLAGWVQTGNLGNVSFDEVYWNEGIPFRADGALFSQYAGGNERDYGDLYSAPFKVGGSGWMTFKLGGARNAERMNLQVVDAKTHEVINRYANFNWTDANLLGCQLNSYKVDLSELIGRYVYIRVVDYEHRDYGCFFLDSVVTYYEAEPSDEFALNNGIGNGNINAGQVFNGGFEDGSFNHDTEFFTTKGWIVEGYMGTASEQSTFWGENIPFGKEGNWLFSAYDRGNEGDHGALISPAFTVAGSGYVSFMIGGFGHPNMHIQVIDVRNGNILDTIYRKEFIGDQQQCKLYTYQLDLSKFKDCVVKLKFVDNASDNYGLIFLDNLVTYYTENPNLSDFRR